MNISCITNVHWSTKNCIRGPKHRLLTFKEGWFGLMMLRLLKQSRRV